MAIESGKTESGSVVTADDSASINPLAADPELLNDFVLESREHLTSIELQLLTLDQDPGNSEAIHAIFRGFHTIKGMAGFLDQDAIRDVAHEVETILDLARNGQLSITSVVIDRILDGKDYLTRCMGGLESSMLTGALESPVRNDALLAAIRSLSAPPERSEVESVAPPVSAPAPPTPPMADVPASREPVVFATEGLVELARQVAQAPPEAPVEPSAPAESAAVRRRARHAPAGPDL
jgi:two-component system chemotaxis sensor kinase CheA